MNLSIEIIKFLGFSPLWMKSTVVLIFAHGFDVAEKFEMSLMCLWICYQVVWSHHHHLIYCAGAGASSTSVGSTPHAPGS